MRRAGGPTAIIETIGGGQGGRPMGPGDDGIQCNMTNTMNTPVEALEITYPLRVERYELREGSAGQGRHRGGNGLVRAIRILGHEARVSLQCERRRFAPYGLHGGSRRQARPQRRAPRRRLASRSCPARPACRSATVRSLSSKLRAAAAGGEESAAISDIGNENV